LKDKKLKDSTVRDWRNYYNCKVRKVREAVTVESLSSKKQGKPQYKAGHALAWQHEITKDSDRYKCCYWCRDWSSDETYQEEVSCGTNQGVGHECVA